MKLELGEWKVLVNSNGLVSNRRQAIAWADDDPVHSRINASLGVPLLTWLDFNPSMNK